MILACLIKHFLLQVHAWTTSSYNFSNFSYNYTNLNYTNSNCTNYTNSNYTVFNYTSLNCTNLNITNSSSTTNSSPYGRLIGNGPILYYYEDIVNFTFGNYDPQGHDQAVIVEFSLDIIAIQVQINFDYIFQSFIHSLTFCNTVSITFYFSLFID